MNNMKKLREQHKMSMQDLANAVNVSKPHICHMEGGKSDNPGIHLAYAIARVFDVSVYDIWPDKTEIEVETIKIRRVKAIKAKDKE